MTTPVTDPEHLLRALLAALASEGSEHAVEGADDGVARLYTCASDRMRGTVGDLASFRRAFRNELYAPLLGQRGRRALGPLERHGDSVRATVQIMTDGDVIATYLFALSISRYGDREGTWVVNGVVREGVDL